MVPYKDGKANHGTHVSKALRLGLCDHRDRILKPMIRAKVSDPWREVSWDEAFAYAASEFKRIQAKYGRLRSAPSPPRAAPMKRPTSSKNSFVPVSATTMSILARGFAIPDRLWPWDRFGTSAGTQDFRFGR